MKRHTAGLGSGLKVNYCAAVRYAKKAAQHLPNARLALVENVGHWDQRDNPTACHRLLLDFLSS